MSWKYKFSKETLKQTMKGIHQRTIIKYPALLEPNDQILKH